MNEGRKAPLGERTHHVNHSNAERPTQRPTPKKESGKVGLAILMWMLGVPGFIVLLYLIFGH